MMMTVLKDKCMKQIFFKALMLVLFSTAGIVSVKAEEAAVGGIYYSFLGDEATVTYNMYMNYRGEIVIPETVVYNGKNYKVTAIGEGAFIRFKNITSVSVPGSVSHIQKSAFADCSRLETVNINNGVVSIGEYAFANCTSLKEITLPNSVTTLGEEAFYRCKSMTSVTLSNKLTTIEYATFQYCETLASVDFPEGITTIGQRAFMGCENLSRVKFPRSLQKICSEAFGEVEKVIIPDLTLWCTLDHSGSISNWHLFADENTEITNLVIPAELTEIGNLCFAGCAGLKSVSIPYGVTKIGNSAFSQCSSLISVSISESVTEIGFGAFMGCTSLSSIKIPESVTTTGTSILYGCTSLSSITIPGSIKKLEEAFFNQCTNLTSVTLSEGVEWIATSAFYLCTSLTDIKLPSTLKQIDYNAFQNCSSLKKIELPDNIGTLTSYIWNGKTIDAFSDCPAEIFTKRGNYTLITLWIKGITPKEIGTGEEMKLPFAVVETTQQSATVTVSPDYPMYSYDFSSYIYQAGSIVDNKILISGLYPEYNNKITIKITTPTNRSAAIVLDALTKDLKPSIKVVRRTASSLTMEGCSLPGDATIASTKIMFNYTQSDSAKYTVTGLEPSKSYEATCVIVVGSGYLTRTYQGNATVATDALTFTSQKPRVVSSGNVVVGAKSNLDDDETDVGFEWRRTDWTDDFESNKGKAYLFDGMMEGYIRNLNADKLWKFRPYYTSNSGVTYYGDWVGIDPTNTSYFEPSVHTYPTVQVEGNIVRLHGYVMRGSDNLTQQGFKYWKQSAGARNDAIKATSVPKDAMIVEADGILMTAELTGLDYESEYCFLAFVKTSENEIFYGELQSFKTGLDVSGIENVGVAKSDNVEIARYDVRGRLLSAPCHGLNIIRMNDGTVKKVMLK